MNKSTKIAPSILSADFSKLGEEIQTISEFADYIHIDIMDGHFVPNITIGPKVVKSLRSHSELVFDVHLMTYNVDHYIKEFAQAGADIITIHAEACTHLDKSLNLIKSLGKKAGVSLVPSSHEDKLDYVMDIADLILVMSVNPGFGGQKFISSQLKKIENIKNKIINTGRLIELEVDGGINPTTGKQVISAGADVLVSGDYIFKDGPENYSRNISSLR
ncbi:MAG: ribulose-phosphate 3-epimerase [Rickettsiales bacterium]|jgi:ribulose-phosphate 3-epimerase|nr:ribulose-phosphate 3-epimerase [Rickettsiales bacterium]